MTIKSLSDTDFLLSVLADGEWHELNWIIDESRAVRGHGLTVHSRAASLRARGHRILTKQHRKTNGRVDSYYRLVTEDEADVGEVPSPSSLGPAGGSPGQASASSSAKQRARGRAESAQRLAEGEQAARGAAEPSQENLACSHVGSSPDAGMSAKQLSWFDQPYVCHVDESAGLAG